MKYLESLALAILAVFAPIQAAVVCVLVLIMADLITGVMAAYKRKERITSRGLKATVVKVMLYEVALCLGFLVQQYLTGDVFPAAKMVSALVGLVELRSILENLDSINGVSLFGVLINKIAHVQDKDRK